MFEIIKQQQHTAVAEIAQQRHHGVASDREPERVGDGPGIADASAREASGTSKTPSG